MNIEDGPKLNLLVKHDHHQVLQKTHVFSNVTILRQNIASDVFPCLCEHQKDHVDPNMPKTCYIRQNITFTTMDIQKNTGQQCPQKLPCGYYLSAGKPTWKIFHLFPVHDMSTDMSHHMAIKNRLTWDPNRLAWHA